MFVGRWLPYSGQPHAGKLEQSSGGASLSATPEARGHVMSECQGWVVLSADERRVLAEMERLYHRQADEPQSPAARACSACAARHRWASVGVIVAAWTALLLATIGATAGAAALATGTSVSWLMWCHLFQPGDIAAGPFDS